MILLPVTFDCSTRGILVDKNTSSTLSIKPLAVYVACASVVLLFALVAESVSLNTLDPVLKRLAAWLGIKNDPVTLPVPSVIRAPAVPGCDVILFNPVTTLVLLSDQSV